MADLPNPTPRALLTEADLQAAFEGIEPGWYRTADLLPRYAAWAEREGRAPTTTRSLGWAIRTAFQPQARKVHGNVAVWYLDEATLTHRAWFKSDES